jgi:hypothetical protein
MILEKSSKIDLIRSFGKLTLSRIVEEKYPSISSLEKVYEPDKIEKICMILVSDLSGSFDDELSDNEVQEIAVEINSTMLRNLSLEDLYLAFKELKSSEIYGRLTVNKTLKHLKKYMERKLDAVYEKNYNRYLELKEGRDDDHTDHIESEKKRNELANTFYQEFQQKQNSTKPSDSNEQ